jgi:hypothetical protein
MTHRSEKEISIKGVTHGKFVHDLLNHKVSVDVCVRERKRCQCVAMMRGEDGSSHGSFFFAAHDDGFIMPLMCKLMAILEPLSCTSMV